MKRVTIFVVLLAVLSGYSNKASAQYYFYNDKYYDNTVTYELGGSVGIMNCLTDLGGNKGIGKKFVKDLNLGKTQAAGSLFFDAMYKNMVALRAEATFGKVAADDKVLEKVKATTFGRYERNLSFRSNISEFMIAAEIHPLYIINSFGDDYDKTPPKFSPYLLAGIGFYHFNPQANLNGVWVDLQPLSTEGQGFAEYPDRKQYSLSQMNIPLGIGVKYDLTDMINLRAEFVYRILSTDYLDDVSTTYVDPTLYSNYFTGSKLTNALLLNARQYELDPTYVVNAGDQRGDSKKNDSYFSFNVKISYTFGRERIK